MAKDTLMAPQRLSGRVWLRAAVVSTLLASDDFVPDLRTAIEQAEALIIGEGSCSTDRLYARFMAWRQARAESIRLAFVLSERVSHLTALILGEEPALGPETQAEADAEAEQSLPPFQAAHRSHRQGCE